MSVSRRYFLKFISPVGTIGLLGLPAYGRAMRRSEGKDWGGLAKRMTGEVVLPAHSHYAEACKLFNPRYDSIRPEGLALCQSAADVSECIAFARRHHLPIAPRSGGHSYAGWSTGPGIVVDVSRMKSVSVDAAAKTVTVGAGARLVDIHDHLAPFKLTIPMGSCPTVGIAGLTLGGGISMVSRQFGLTCDNLLSVDVVTANGRAHTCNAHRNPDLFWACRGGGGANFGIATSFTYRAHPAPDVTHQELEWPWSDAPAVVKAWQSWAPAAPDEVWSNCQLRFDVSREAPRARVTVVGLGSQQNLDKLIDDFVSQVRSQPTRLAETDNHLQAMLALAGCRKWSVDECALAPRGKVGRAAYAAKSDFFSNPLSRDAIAIAMRHVEQARASGRLSSARISFDAFGGAINRVPAHETAFVHRNALFSAQYLAYWPEESSARSEVDGLQWLRAFHQTMRPHANGGAYVNYTDPDLATWKHAYYGSNYLRLLRVKRLHDPAGIFRLPQGVGS